MIDFNFLEDNKEVRDFFAITEKICFHINKNVISLLEYLENNENNTEIYLYFVHKLSEIVSLGVRFDENGEFDRLWNKGKPTPMFSQQKKQSIERILREIIEGRVEFSTAKNILDSLRGTSSSELGKFLRKGPVKDLLTAI